ncbi:MAG: hypothetical protein C0467_27190 [Planctomycetaceae bacterium]|nr:hypothetical protein [Planctomycetaceae bacterium]
MAESPWSVPASGVRAAMQTEAEAFLQRIRAYPDDDAPRLIYADWLEEQGAVGNPEWGPERAYLIRVQIALARLHDEVEPDEPNATPSARAERERARTKLHGRLLVAERDLLDSHREDWTIPFRGLATGLEFRRGFVEEVKVSVLQWIRHAHELFVAGPVRHVALLDLDRNLPLAFQCPYLNRLAALTVYASHKGQPLARAVADSPHLAGLKRLYLGRNRFEDNSAEHLATSTNLANLEELDLTDNELGETGARALAASSHLGNVRYLELRNNRLGPTGAEAVAGSERLTSLHRLGLAGNEIGVARLHTISRAHDLLRVPILDLSNNNLNAAGLHVILTRASPMNESGVVRLQELDLGQNDQLGNEGARVLAGCPHLAGLRVLRLRGCQIGDDGARALAESQYLNHLTTLDLAFNPLGDTGCRPFLKTQLRSLRHLIVPNGVTQGLRRHLEMRNLRPRE